MAQALAVVLLAYAGIGYETAKVLLAKGYNVTLACRDASRAASAVQRLQQQQPGAPVDYLLLDLADLASVRDAANKWMDSGKQIDVLLNNAGGAGLQADASHMTVAALVICKVSSLKQAGHLREQEPATQHMCRRCLPRKQQLLMQ